MKAIGTASRDESDEMLDRAIFAVTTQPSPTDIKNRVLETAASFSPRAGGRFQFLRRRSWRIAASAVAAIVAASVLALLMLPSASVGWADVVKTMNSQKWIRISSGPADPKQTKNNWTSAMWISPSLKVWAFGTGQWFIFFDGRRQEKYEYRTGEKQIVKMLLGEDDSQRFQAVDYMSQGSWMFGTERLMAKNRREVTEAGEKWIEFDVVFSRGPDDVSTMRVDPETRLPVTMLTSSSKDPQNGRKYTYDYPADGPADIYALGVPPKITIDDRMPSPDCLRVLRGMAASRARIGDFRLEVVVADSPLSDLVDHSSWFGASLIVWRKGDRWRVDLCRPEKTTNPDGRQAEPPDGLGWRSPSAKKLKLRWMRPRLICDGRMVYEAERTPEWGGAPGYVDPQSPGPAGVKWKPSHILPQDLLSGDVFRSEPWGARIASALYPDLSPIAGWGFEFNPRPADAPGCVLIRRSAISTRPNTLCHELYYIDPAKGYAVVRNEGFNLPADAPADPKAVPHGGTRMLDFQQSPQGFWYPKSIRCESVLQLLGSSRKARSKAERTVTTTYTYYHFDFDVPLPDSLFVVDHASKSKQ